MTFKCSNHFKIVFDYLWLSINAFNKAFLCKNCVKYQYTIRAVCTYAHAFRKRPGCALIRMNTVSLTRTKGTKLKL